MSNLLGTLISSARALGVFDQALMISQNNVANASTPGYAAQRLSLEAVDFDASSGPGGVMAGEVQSARSPYAEQDVRRQVELLGNFQQMSESLSAVESYFPVADGQGISGALNSLFRSFSAWSLEPNSQTARQSILDSGRRLAEVFQQTAANMTNASADADRQLRQTVDQVNQIGAALQQINGDRRRGGQNDAGLDTKLHAELERLSELVSFTPLFQPDGTVTILIGGQSPLVIGENLYRIGVNSDMPTDPPPVYDGASAPARLFSPDGAEITGLVSQGRLAGLIQIRNEVLPSLAGDAYHAGDLNVLAKSIADRVNEILTSSLISEGPPPVGGVPMFTYDAANAANVAHTISLDPGITAGQLAGISPGPPFVINGAALQLSNLANPQDDQDKIDGTSFVAFYGLVSGRVGRLLSDSRENQNYRSQMVVQARSLRSQLSAVSLDEEATLVIGFQRAYQANSRMVVILNELLQNVIDMMR